MVNIVRLCAEDLVHVERLQALAYQDPALVEDIAVHADRLAKAPHLCFAAHVDGQLAGYIVTHPWETASWPGLNIFDLCLDGMACDAVHIHDIAVDARFQGRRIAPLLVEAALQAAADAGIQTAHLVAVDGAHTFWQRQGFTMADGPRPPYGDDAWWMVRRLA